MYFIRFLFKGFSLISLYVKRDIFTCLFKFRLKINHVTYKKGLKTFNSIPDLVINRKARAVSLGEHVVFNNYTDQSWNSKCKIYVRQDAILIIGNNSGINGSLIYCENRVIIGDYVNIGGGTRISDSNHHNLDWKARRNPQESNIAKTAPIVIEDDVFIGANCYIGKGVTIGARTIIAAGSVVVKSIPSDCIAGGNPCVVIKQLVI